MIAAVKKGYECGAVYNYRERGIIIIRHIILAVVQIVRMHIYMDIQIMLQIMSKLGTLF